MKIPMTLLWIAALLAIFARIVCYFIPDAPAALRVGTAVVAITTTLAWIGLRFWHREFRPHDDDNA